MTAATLAPPAGGFRRWWRSIRGDARVAMLIFGAVLRVDGRSLWFSVAACAIAATVATFQFAVFTSFLAAGAAGPRFIGADAWITDHGIDCFDFPTPIEEGYRGAILAELPGARIDRIVIGYTGWISPTGGRGNVALIGVDAGGGSASLGPRAFMAEASDLKRLELSADATSASIGGRSVEFAEVTDRLATFLGAPYVVMDYDAAHAILGYPTESAAMLAVHFPDGPPADLDERLKRIEERFPEIRAHSGRAFEASSSAYWQHKTGAGAAILLAATLASLLMVLLVVNSVGRFVQRRQADIISMLGHGASPGQVRGVLIAMAGFLVLASLGATLLLVPLFVAVAHPFLPWVGFSWPDLVFLLGISSLCLIASLLATAHELGRFPADAIFRS